MAAVMILSLLGPGQPLGRGAASDLTAPGEPAIAVTFAPLLRLTSTAGFCGAIAGAGQAGEGGASGLGGGATGTRLA